MKTWSCPKKKQARADTILSLPRPRNQYWSMAGLCTTPGCEVDQLQGFIRPDQFHGVEIRRDIHEANCRAHPGLHWHHGDFFETMRQFSDFNPSLVNADLLNTIDTASDYVARILCLLVPFRATLLVNLIMEYRGYACNADYVLERLAKCPQFRFAVRRGYRHDGQCYLYAGTGNKTRTIMGTFLFSNQWDR